MKASLINKFHLRLNAFPLALFLSLLSIESSAQYSKVLNFESTSFGGGPEGSLLYDGTFMYGTTRFGGLNNSGTVFKIKPDGTGYTRLLDFEGTTNGRGALSSLIYDGTFLYGMTSLGGANDQGTIFKIKTDGTGYSKLLDFDQPTSGWYPESSLFYDGTFLYGAATIGGSNGQGTLFKIKTDGTGYVTLLNFSGAINGSNPYSSLIDDGIFLYGTTRKGGANDLGTIFKIKPDGSGYVNLLNFSGVANGGEPNGDLFYDGTFLYGTTLSGGINNIGTLYKIKPDGSGYIKLLDFSGTATGDSPTGSLILDGTFLYGMTAAGGSDGLGTIFKMKTDGTAFSKLTDFNGTNGRLPLGSLISDGVFLYGMTSEGGTNNVGTLFKYSFVSSIPTITNFSPSNGAINTTITITGTNFSTTPSGNIVFFGATKATVSSATSTQLTVTVPAGATYQPISVLVNGLTAYSAKPFIVTFGDGGVINACTFATNVEVTTGSQPYSIAIGDLDSDNKPDLVVANKASNTVSVFKNISTAGTISSSSFAAPVNFNTNLKPFYVGIQDLDGDGKPELVVTNNDSDNVSVYKNITTAGIINSTSFAAKVDFATGENPWNAAIDDFDLDGKPDLAIVNDVSNTVSVLRNTGVAGIIDATSFATKVDFGTGNFPIGIASGDLDRNGKPDLVITNQTDNSISVLRNAFTTGSITPGSFANKLDFPVGLDPYSVAIGDLDNDGKPEVVVANFSSGTASVFNNTSTSGAISFLTKIDFNSGAGSLTVAINDIDGDGKPDLATANGNSRISLLKNLITASPISSTSFSPRVDFASASDPYGLAIGDLDGNGKPDIATTNFNGTSASILRNRVSSLPSFLGGSFSPNSGPIGTVVTLTGTNFSTTPLNNTVKFNGVTATVTSATSTSITVIVPAGATTGSISIEVGCQTAITVFPFTITTGNTITVTTQPADASVCTDVTATFTTAATGTTNIVYQWQFSANSPIAFADISNNTNYSGATTAMLSVITTGGFGVGRYRCKISGDIATTVFTNDQGLFVNTLPAPPTTTGASRCGSGSVSLSASGGSNGQYRWYTVSSGGGAINGEANSTFTTPAISGTTTYYVAVNIGTCESNRAVVIATINTIPSAPVTTNANFCPGGNSILKATGGTNGQYSWYTAATGGTALPGEVNDSYTTSSLTATTTYYVSITNNGCESARTPATSTLLTSGCSAPPPVITTMPLNTQIEGKIVINLVTLITTSGTLDINSIQLITPPSSGAIASISGGILTIDYTGNNFAGNESVTIEACNQNGACSQQVFSIEVAGDLIVYNAISPNDDDKNEFLRLQYIDVFQATRNNKVSIFNRWGDLVFEVSNYDNKENAFKGLNRNGNELPSGIYFYKIEFTSGLDVRSGYLTLKR